MPLPSSRKCLRWPRCQNGVAEEVRLPGEPFEGASGFGDSGHGEGVRLPENGTSFEIEKRELVAEKQPMHEFSTPEQIGALAAFLCSDDARTITGTPLSIDGGWLAQ